MANTILNFHFDYLNTSLTNSWKVDLFDVAICIEDADPLQFWYCHSMQCWCEENHKHKLGFMWLQLFNVLRQITQLIEVKASSLLAPCIQIVTLATLLNSQVCCVFDNVFTVTQCLTAKSPDWRQLTTIEGYHLESNNRGKEWEQCRDKSDQILQHHAWLRKL